MTAPDHTSLCRKTILRERGYPYMTRYFHRDLTHPQLCVVVYDAVNVLASFAVFFAASELTLKR
jgi:hypothetical protein